MKRIVFAAALCGVIFSSSAPAQTIDKADGFYAACQAADNLNLCAMYMAGFTSGVQAQSVVSKATARYCLPPGTTHKQNLDTVLNFLSANPAERGQPTLVVVYLALTKAHPCK
ncbi:hypothetical protein P3T23_008441 [Paraburkholderia sp. GAS448]|uniref:Rap1a/Tai family immunity protein n=1 Tax=Paraburkholderia sp. GAS448 TaxID=3035136 RepID=UPI003D19189C